MVGLLRPTLRAASVLALAAACDGGQGESDSANMDNERPCDDDTLGDHFEVGLTRLGAAMSVSLLDALPAPPGKGDNSWTLVITDATGAPIDGLSPSISTFMPVHDHGGVGAVGIAGDEPGEYVFQRLYLSMAGLWEISVEADLGDGVTDVATFRFCVNP